MESAVPKGGDRRVHTAQLARAGTPGPLAIGIDEIAIRKGHTYRIVVSDLPRRRPIWFGGTDRSEASMAQFYAWLGKKKSARVRLAVMDMWKALLHGGFERRDGAVVESFTQRGRNWLARVYAFG